jgi:hypothetical protein
VTLSFDAWLDSISDPSAELPDKLKALMLRAYDAGFEAGAIVCTDALAKKHKVSRRKMSNRILKKYGSHLPRQQ